MKFTVSQQLLNKTLNTVSKAVTNRTTIPVLKGILLDASGSQVRLAASDLDFSIEKKIEASVSEEGSLVLPARLFCDIIRKLPNADVEIEEKENNTVAVRCLSSEFTIVGMSAEDFPGMGEINEQDRICFNKTMFRDLIKKTSFAASIDESRGVITGVLIEMEKDSLSMVALDGFRMAIARETVKNESDKKIIISSRILNEINKIITDSDDEEDIFFILDSKKAAVVSDQTRIVIRLLEGEFIKYKDILPKENQCRLIISRDALLNSIERASLLAKEGKNNLIKLKIEGNIITITSRSEEGNVKETVEAEKSGEDLEIGFNSKYMLDALKVISDEDISMEFNNSVSPCLVKPVSGDAYEYLILPVRISGN